MAHFCKKLQADCRRGWMLALTAMLIVFAPAAFAQSAPTVTGTVTDQSGQPVIGATIIEHSLVALKIFQIFRKQGTKLTLFIRQQRISFWDFRAKESWI